MKHVIVSRPIEWLEGTFVDDCTRELYHKFEYSLKFELEKAGLVMYVPTQIFVNNGVTVCKFADGDVVTSKPRDGEPFDPEVGVAMCIVKKLFRGRGRWLSYLRDKVKYQERKVKK